MSASLTYVRSVSPGRPNILTDQRRRTVSLERNQDDFLSSLAAELDVSASEVLRAILDEAMKRRSKAFRRTNV